MISRLIAFGVVIGLLYGGGKMLVGQAGFVTNFAKIAGVSSEVRAIAKMIYYDYVISGTSLETLSQDAFSNYLREQMKSTDSTRDTAQDLWFTLYRLCLVDGNRFEVGSAGPDCSFDTGDDITAGGRSR